MNFFVTKIVEDSDVTYNLTVAYEKQLRNWGHGLETVEMHLFTVVLKVV